MRAFQPGRVAVPLVLLFGGAFLTMDRLDIIQLTRFWSLWPIILIAAGIEQLYFWAISRDDQ